ncbi:alpha-1,2-mannosidase [Protomyces lactucae-debilis]|uniref:Alpha-1,2-mannosidase n=1 Tax=Protomyces lactucae-debilis TaxID=2754530 RepID=A0A1Y2EZI5_PROLT|nr:alpha-1,2-mannosidase [Protomyces lactucae-debilis]ORY77018.1 alpha-1,2-mannosidase [Protomyces lactucae-debilis]
MQSFFDAALSRFQSVYQQPLCFSPVHHVDPFIGVAGGGHVFPGAASPFGSVKVGIDTTDTAGLLIGSNNAGWSMPEAHVTAISYLHVSGTGGGAKYGFLSQIPTDTSINYDLLNGYSSHRSREVSTPGYYAFHLDAWGVDVELTTTTMVGIAKYNYTELAKRADAGQVILDLGHVLGSAQTYRGGSVHINPGRSQITGHATYRGGWNMGDDMTVYFCSQFDRSADGQGETQGIPAPAFGTWKNTATHAGYDFESDTGDWVGAYLVFDISKDPIVNSKLGISFLSADKACAHIEQQTGKDFDFEAQRKAAASVWNETLSTIRVAGPVSPNAELGADVYMRIFYSSLYRMHIMPSNRKGENPKWNTSMPVYDDFYTIWDTFRCSSPLLTLIQPDVQTEILQSLLDVQQHEGWTFDGRSAGTSGLTQGGSNADMILVDAFVKGLTLDWDAVWDALLADADNEPPFEDGLRIGRSKLEAYKQLGYVPQDPHAWWDGRSMSKTMEYAANDRVISLFATGTAREAEALRFLKRSTNWRTLWQADRVHANQTGWLVPKFANGTAYPWDLDLHTGRWNEPVYEGSAIEYQFAVPHDVQGLICLFGSRDIFSARLDYMFETSFDPGNEPSFLSPFLYLWTGEYSKTVDKTLHILGKYYHDGLDGIPGNDDSGAMGAYFCWLSMGLYPVTATNLYLISSPTFRHVEINVGKEVLAIEARDLSRENRYIQRATLNGKKLDRAWFTHGEIDKGATLILWMGPSPSVFGTLVPPPSDTTSCEQSE